MKLSLREFSDVVAVLRPAGRDASELRRASRVDVFAKLSAFLLDAGKITRTYTLLTRDVSTSGMGAFQYLTVPAKTDVLLELPRASGPLLVCATIIHCRPMADRIYGVGITFTAPASPGLAEELANFKSNPEERAKRAVLD